MPFHASEKSQFLNFYPTIYFPNLLELSIFAKVKLSFLYTDGLFLTTLVFNYLFKTYENKF